MMRLSRLPLPMVISKACWAVRCTSSSTLSVKVLVPDSLGLPEINTLFVIGLSDRPAGRLPATTVQVNGGASSGGLRPLTEVALIAKDSFALPSPMLQTPFVHGWKK